MNYTFMSEYSLYHILKDAVSHEITEHFDGYRIVVEYPNGYGAMIDKCDYSKGDSADLWELTVLHDGEYTWETPLTNNTVGWLDDSEVESFCNTIRGWDENGNPTDGWSFEEECEYYEHYITNHERQWMEEENDKALMEWYEENPEDDWWTMEDEDEQYD